MATRAENERANRIWYEEYHRQISGRAGLTLQEFRAKPETTRGEILRDPERYRIESKEQSE